MALEEQTAPEQEPADDIRSLLTNALQDSETPAPETPEEPAASRARGPDGKFVKADDAPVEIAAPPDAALQTQPEVAVPEQPEAVAAPAVDPIKSWSEADKAMFAKMPAEAQQFLVRREKEMTADHTRKTMAIADLKRDYEPIQQMFEPHKAQLQSSGYTPQRLVSEWMAVERRLQQGDGINVILDVMRGYRIAPQQLLATLGVQGAPGQQPQQQAPQSTDPMVASLQQQLQGLTQQWQRQEAEKQQAAQRQHMAEIQRVTGEIETFRTATDDAGALSHPHYDELETTIANLAQAERAAGRAPSLNDLYEQAVWANPSTRAKQLAANDTAQRAKAQDEARAKAAAAKKASSSVTGAPSSGQTPRANKGDLTLRQQLEEAAADAAA